MKQTAVEWLVAELRKYGSPVPRQDEEHAKEMEKQQKGYSEETVELIANEMVNWTIDNIGNPNAQSGKKFDEVLNKYKNVIG